MIKSGAARTRLQTLIARICRRPGPLEALGSKNAQWTIPTNLLSKSSVCYCVGCGEDVSFDLALADKFGCHVWSYDPTPRAITYATELRDKARNNQSGSTASKAANGDGAEQDDVSSKSLALWTFAPLGVWSSNQITRFYAPANDAHVSHSILNLQKSETYFEADCRTLATLMTQNGHAQIDMLKLDVEGAEYEIIESMRRDQVKPTIVCVEFDEGHHPLDHDAQSRIANSISTLHSMGYWLVYRRNWDFTFVL